MAAAGHFVLRPSQSTTALKHFSYSCDLPPYSSSGCFCPLNKNMFGRRSKFLQPNSSVFSSNNLFKVFVYSKFYGARIGNHSVNRFTSFRSPVVQLLDLRRKVLFKTMAKDLFRLRAPGVRISVSRSIVKPRASLGGDAAVDLYGDVIAEDYYSVLGLTPDATPEEIKKAYYSCMKSCHPDLTGNRPAVNEFCIFVNEVYEVLSDPEQRMIYDEINGYSLTAINPFIDNSMERNHTFVDEFTCIGCKNCANTAPATFEIEEDYGRARVVSQVENPVLVERAIQTCPVDCIYWVTPAQLTLLEDEMRIVERVNVGMMLSGQGYQAPDVFTQASWKWEKRQAKAVERARVRLMKEGGKSGNGAWWKVNWGSASDDRSSKAAADKYARERAARTAAAARRWREYSRQGVDRRAILNLPSASWSDVGEDAVEKEKAGAK